MSCICREIKFLPIFIAFHHLQRQARDTWHPLGIVGWEGDSLEGTETGCAGGNICGFLQAATKEARVAETKGFQATAGRCLLLTWFTHNLEASCLLAQAKGNAFSCSYITSMMGPVEKGGICRISPGLGDS